MMQKWNNEQLISEHKWLTQLEWDRTLRIAEEQKERHERINFENPLFVNQLKTIEQELKDRGLK